MLLYIRDDAVDALAAKVQAATGLRTKTDAVRLALEHELTRIAAAKSFATAVGATVTSLEIRRRSRLSRGRSIKRCGPKLTG